MTQPRDAVENRREQVPRDRPLGQVECHRPFRYLADVLRRLPTTPSDRLTELLPDVWFLAYPQAAGKRTA